MTKRAIDFLRGVIRLPVVGSLPPGDYYAIISRASRRPRCEVYARTLRDKVPLIPIPLKLGDDDAVVSLQEVFETLLSACSLHESQLRTEFPEPGPSQTLVANVME